MLDDGGGGDSSTKMWPLILLAGAKCFKSFSIFSAAAMLASGVPVELYLFFLLLGAALFLFLSQRPWLGKRLQPQQWSRIVFNAFLYVLGAYFYHNGLHYYGPIATILTAEYTDIILAPLFSANKRGNKTKTRGALVCLAAYFILFLVNFHGSNSTPTQTSNTNTGDEEERRATEETIATGPTVAGIPVPEGLYGAVNVVIAIMISFARKQYVRKISAQVGTSKRLHSLSLGAGAVMLFPFAVYKYFTAPTFEFSFGTVISIVIFSVFFLVFDYYVDIISHAKIGATSAVVMTGLISCCAFAFLSEWWNQGPGFAFLNLFCFVVLLFGVYLRFGLEGREKSKGGLADLPLHSGALSAHYSVTSRRVWQFLKASLHEIIRNGESRSIFGFLLLNLTFMFVEMVYGFWTNSLGLISDAFHMLFDCTALLIGLYASVISKWEANQVFTYGYARVEVLSGFVNSVFLVCIAFFVLLESIERFLEPPKIDTERLLLVSFLGLLVNLVGVFAFSHGHSHGHSHGGESHGHSHSHSHSHSKKKKHGHGHAHSHGHGHDEHHDDHSHSHSHSHAHSHHFEAEQHSHAHSHQHSHPHHRKDSKKYDDFHHHHHHEKEEDLFHNNNSNNNTWKAILLQPWNKAKEMISGGISENLSGIWLHVMADTLGSVGVIISSLCVMYFDWAIADPICSFCIALLILLSIIPLLKGSAATLAQRTPENMEGDLRNLVQKVVAMEVVMGVREVHFWRHSGDVIVGTMHVQIQNEADEQKVQRKVHKLFGGLVEHLTVQVEKERFFELETQLQKQNNNPISYAAFMTPASTPSFGMAASPSSSSSSSLTSLASPSSSFASLSSSSFSSSSSSALLVPQMIVEQP